MHIYFDFSQEVLCFRSSLMRNHRITVMLTVAYCSVLKIANIYPLAVWAFLAVSSELLENEILNVFKMYFI